MLGLEAAPVLDGLHYLSAGAVGFARGLNDTPKIVALLLTANILATDLELASVAALMALGGMLSARRVAGTMSRRITRMNAGQGFAANLVTSVLVVLASLAGLPVSTTHVSVGALFGIGVVNGTARKGTALAIVLEWITTLPLGALLGGAAYWMLI
jgi:PiT family inorganic phosphate transporter